MVKSSDLWPLSAKTNEIHGGGLVTDKFVRPRLVRVVAEPLGTYENGAKIFSGEKKAHAYSRISNETVENLEKRMCILEGSNAALAAASGMAAIDVLYRFLTKCGDHIISSPKVYGGVDNLFRVIKPRDGVEVSFVKDPHDVNEWERLIRPNTKAFHIENPSNPLIDVFDIRPLAQLAHSAGRDIQVVVDHTLATHVLYQPFLWGADWIGQSITKYIGDGEEVAGIIHGKDQKIIDQMRMMPFRNTGACLSPDNAHILLYHIESISSRMKEHCRNAELMAEFLSKSPLVDKVYYPTLGPLAPLNRQIMRKGFGGMLSFDLKGDESNVGRFMDHLKLFDHAANIGEARSLVIGPWLETHGCMEPNDRLAAGIHPTTVRLALGREEFADLREDLLRNGFSKVKVKKSQRP
ncbi:aminotransferase class I/II-fold pyridoxal phosphate-dependent enzyme [Candidatus Giovannonibacteria bacterium]|nr:aminotransferase class I/II-fold pyridoxal phosphate-dependent enzyme [Candidatus Giovannonibacteria bacterium]